MSNLSFALIYFWWMFLLFRSSLLGCETT